MHGWARLAYRRPHWALLHPLRSGGWSFPGARLEIVRAATKLTDSEGRHFIAVYDSDPNESESLLQPPQCLAHNVLVDTVPTHQMRMDGAPGGQGMRIDDTFVSFCFDGFKAFNEITEPTDEDLRTGSSPARRMTFVQFSLIISLMNPLLLEANKARLRCSSKNIGYGTVLLSRELRFDPARKVRWVRMRV